MASRESFDETPRKNSLDDSFFDSLSPQERDGLRDECARLALALTALFDDEANVEESLLARTHLDECAQCDGVWQVWNQQNQMLRHLSAPAVPPGLLLRILTAIRLLSLLPQMRARVEAKISHFEPPCGSVSDARLLPEVIFADGANPFAPRRHAPRLSPKIEAPRELPPLDPMAPLPPANLRDDILRRTIGEKSAEVGIPEKINVPLVACGKSDIDFEPQGRAQDSTQRSIRARRTLRFSSTVVPALAAWLIFLSGPSALWAPLLEPGAPSRSEPKAALRNERRIVPIAPKAAIKSAALVDDNRHSNSVITDGMGDGMSGESKTNSQRAIAPEKQAIIEEPVVLMVRNNKANPALPLAASIAPVSLLQPTRVAPPQTLHPQAMSVTPPSVPSIVMLPKVMPEVRRRPATTTADMELRMRHASWSAPTSDGPVLRSSSVPLPGNYVTAPQPVNVGDNAENDTDTETETETLEHVNRLNDARPEDVRNVLDDFRASLLADSADDDSAVPGTQG